MPLIRRKVEGAGLVQLGGERLFGDFIASIQYLKGVFEWKGSGCRRMLSRMEQIGQGGMASHLREEKFGLRVR